MTEKPAPNEDEQSLAKVVPMPGVDLERQQPEQQPEQNNDQRSDELFDLSQRQVLEEMQGLRPDPFEKEENLETPNQEDEPKS